jgi:hypothetical protein
LGIVALLEAVPTATFRLSMCRESCISFEHFANLAPRLVALGKKFLIANRDNLTRMATAFVSILVAVNLRVGIVALLDEIINRLIKNDNRNRCLIQVINLLGSERIRVRICEVTEKVHQFQYVWIRHQFAFRG